MNLRRRSPYGVANIVLVVLIVAINGYVLVLPLVPQVQLWRRQHQLQKVHGLPYQTRLDKNSPAAANRAAIPADNRLVIPALALDQHIYEGASPYLVNRGVWARPNTSTPPAGSNTVLVGHRFTYSGPAVFYSLDRLKTGDTVVLYWQHKEYDYKINASQVVPPTQLAVEAPSSKPELTIYTCTPLWSAKNRLVITASPLETKGTRP